MKKNQLKLGVLVCCFLAFATTSFKADPGKGIVNGVGGPAKKAAATYNFTLSQNSITASQYYRIQFTSSTYTQVFTFGSGVAQNIPAGTYTVYIFPATSASNHNFSGQSCANTYSGSGQSVIFSNVLVCSDGFFTIN